MFEVTGLDGVTAEVDLSAPGEFGDLAFYVHVPGTRPLYYCAYHVAEAAIFTQLLQAMALNREPATALADVARLRNDVRRRTTGSADATVISQNNFDSYVLELGRPAVSSTRSYSARAQGSQKLVVTSNGDGLRFEMRADPDARSGVFELSQSDTWKFGAGMMWRSYNGHGSRAPVLTRLSTAAYEGALAAFERGLRGRLPQ